MKFSKKLLALYGLLILVVFLVPILPQPQTHTQPVTMPETKLPTIQPRSNFWDFWLTIRDWLISNLQSGHQLQGFFGSFTSNIPEWVRPYELLPTVQAANLGGSTLGSLTYVDPSFSLAGGKYDYATTFGHYTLSLAKSENAYIVSWQSPDAVGKNDVASTAFILLENGNFLPDNWSTQVTFTAQTPYALNDHFDGSWEVRQKSTGLLIGTAHLIVQFQRTALPKISANIVKEWYYTNPLCTSSREDCPTETYWNQVGLGSLQWVWQIAPNAGCDSVNGLNVANLTASSDGTKLSSSSKLDFASCSWSASWQEYGSLPVEVQVDGDKKGKGVFSKGAIEVKFPANMDSVDPTFGITTAGTSAYPRAKSITANGGAQIVTAQSKFGGASGDLTAGNWLTSADSADWFFGTGDLTIDFWARFNSLPGVGVFRVFVDQRDDSTHEWFVYVENLSGVYNIGVFNAGGFDIERATSPSLATATWYHIAIVRSGTNIYVFQDGTQLGTTGSSSASIPDLASSLYINRRADGTNGNDVWLDDLEMLKGTARWTSNFTAPTVPWPRSSTTVLLLPMDGVNASTTFLDDVITGQTIYTKATLSGSATVTSVSFCSLTTSGSVILAIWTDSSGPSVLLWNSSTSGTSVNASACSGSSNWTTINISSGSPTALNLGTASYWLGFQWTFVSNTYYAGPAYASGGANTGAYTWDNFGTLQSTVSSPTLSTENWSMYVTYSANVAYSRPISETSNLLDKLFKGQPRSPTDTVNLIDTIKKGVGKFQSETLNWIDTLTKGTGKPLSEILTLIDTVTQHEPNSNHVLTETLNVVSNGAQLLTGIGKFPSDILTFLDMLIKGQPRAIADALNLNAVLAHGVGKPLSETLNLLDNITKGSNKFVSDLVTFTDKITKGSGRALTETLNLTEFNNRLRSITRSFAETLNLTETLTRLRNIPKSMSDALNFLDTLTIHFAGIGSGTISDALNLSDTLTRLRNVPKSLTDVLTLFDTLTKGTNKPIAEAMNLLDTLLKGSGTKLLETLSISDTLTKGVGKILSDILNLIESLTAQKSTPSQNYPVSLSDTLNLISTFLSHYAGQFSALENLNITPTLNMFYQGYRSFLETLNLNGSLTSQFVGARNLSEMLNLIDTLTAHFIGSRGQSEVLNLSDLIKKNIGKFPTANLNLSDTVTRFYQGIRTLQDTLNWIDSVVAQKTSVNQNFNRALSDTLNQIESLTRICFGQCPAGVPSGGITSSFMFSMLMYGGIIIFVIVGFAMMMRRRRRDM